MSACCWPPLTLAERAELRGLVHRLWSWSKATYGNAEKDEWKRLEELVARALGPDPVRKAGADP